MTLKSLNEKETVGSPHSFLVNKVGDNKKYYSLFWRKFLSSRKNFPLGDDLKEFLSRGFADGYGSINSKDHEAHFSSLVDTFENQTPISFMQKFVEPDFGNSSKFTYKEITSSIVFLHSICASKIWFKTGGR